MFQQLKRRRTASFFKNNLFYEYDGISGKTMSLRDPLVEDVAVNAAVQIRPNDFDDMVTTTSGIKAYARFRASWPLFL